VANVFLLVAQIDIQQR